MTSEGDLLEEDEHAARPSDRLALISLGLLLVSLVAVVGLAKVESSPIEDAVASLGLPQAVVGVIIALLVLLPESIAAYNAARRGRTQISLNLALGSAMASIGLTIPTIAVASIWLDGPLRLGLDPTHIVLLALTVGGERADGGPGPGDQAPGRRPSGRAGGVPGAHPPALTTRRRRVPRRLFAHVCEVSQITPLSRR